MTVETLTFKVTGSGNGSATVFSFSPIVLFEPKSGEDHDLEVTHIDTDGTETVLSEGTGASAYSVDVSTYPGTGDVIYPEDEVTPMASGESIIIKRKLSLKQLTNLENQGGYFPDTQEKTFDRLVMMIQQIQEEVDRSLKYSVRETVSDPSVGAIEDIKGKLLGFDDSDGTPTVFTETPNTWRNGTGAPSDSLGQNGDFYIDTDTTELWGPKASGSWSGTGPTSLIPGLAIIRDPFTGDGTTGPYGPMSQNPASDNDIVVYINGVLQADTADYSVSGDEITFSSAVSNGDDIDVLHNVGGSGPAGQGIAAGGSTNDFLRKASGTDYDTQWDTISTVSQAEAEAGTATTDRLWTAERVKQAIDAVETAVLPRGHLSGLGLSNGGTDPNHDIAVSEGKARDGDDTENMELTAALTKRLDAAWAVGDDAGGLDTGTVAADTWYHVWLIKRTDTGVVDVLFSTSVSSPTMPTNYDKKRRIGSVLTNGSADIIAFDQFGDDFWWLDPPLDVNDSSPGTSANTATLTVPTGVRVLTRLHLYAPDMIIYLSPLSVNDEVPSESAAPLATAGNATGGTNSDQISIATVLTNTSAQIRYRAGSNRTVRIATLGWIDRRGRDD